MSVNEKIRLIRETKGLTQEQVAEKLGVSPTVYGDIERGSTNLKLNRLEKIAEILGVQLPELIDSSDNGNLNINFKGKQRDVYCNSSAIELEKQLLINELKDKEISMLKGKIDDLKIQITQLQKINALLEKNS